MTAKSCGGIGRTIYADVFENQIKAELEKKINLLSVTAPEYNINKTDREIESLKIDIGKLDDKISSFIEKIEDADITLMKYINNKVAELENEKQHIRKKIDKLESAKPDYPIDEITDCMKIWDEMSFDDKRAVVKILIKRILITKTGFQIEWNI